MKQSTSTIIRIMLLISIILLTVPLHSMELMQQQITIVQPLQNLAKDCLDKKTIKETFDHVFNQLCIYIAIQNNPTESTRWLLTHGDLYINQNLIDLQKKIKQRYSRTIQDIYKQAPEETRYDHIRELNIYYDTIANSIHQSTRQLDRKIKLLIQIINTTKSPHGSLIDRLQNPLQLQKAVERKIIGQRIKKCGKATVCAATGAGFVMMIQTLLNKII